MPPIQALDRLKSQLLTSGIQEKNQPLFQVINQLIDFIRQSITESSARIGTIISNPPSPVQESNKLLVLGTPFTDNDCCDLIESLPGSQGLQGIQGIQGKDGLNVYLPYDEIDKVEESIQFFGLIHFPEPGKWIEVPYDASNFFTSSGLITWTVESGDQISYSYMLINKTMFVRFTFNNTSVSGIVGSLRFRIPAGATAKVSAGNPTMLAIRALDNGTENIGFNNIVAGQNYIQLFNGGFANWSTSTNNTTVQGMAIFEIN